MLDGTGINKLNEIFKVEFLRDQLKKYKVVFILGEPSSHKTILQKMCQRKNNIDILNINYVNCQYQIFNHLRTFEMDNFKFVSLTTNDLYRDSANFKIGEVVESMFINK